MPRPEVEDTQARAHPDEIEPIGVGRLLGYWALRTQDSYADALLPGYFDTVAGHGLRRHDRIEAVFQADGDSPEHALLVIDAMRNVGGAFDQSVTVGVLRAPVEKKAK